VQNNWTAEIDLIVLAIVTGAVVWSACTKDVNVVRHHLNAVQNPFICLAHSPLFASTQSHCAFKHLMTVLGAENDVVSEAVLGKMTTLS
jgi:hypothetical protein